MTLLRTASAALTILAAGTLIALPTTAGATSIARPNPEPVYVAHEALLHNGTKVGTGNATVTGGLSSMAFTHVYAKLSAPKAGVTWKARMIATYSCATDVPPTAGGAVQITRFKTITAWTVTKLTGTSGILPAKGFHHRCNGGEVLHSGTKVRLQVSRPSGLSYALSTIFTV